VNAGQSVSGSYTLQADVGKLTVKEHQFLTQRGFSQQGNTVPIFKERAIWQAA
jgi:hypothetical protein